MISPQATLAQLEHADLIRMLRELETAYQFKHNLVQESVYASLLKHDRRVLNLDCARVLEQLFPHELDENAVLLARYYQEAGDDGNAFRFARRAGDAAFRVHAIPEALMHYETAATLAGKLELDPTEILDVHQKRGRALEVSGRYEEAIAEYLALQQLGVERDEPRYQLGALLSLGTLYTFPNFVQDLTKSLEANQAALALAREIGDEPSEGRALWNMQQYNYFSGHPEEGLACGRRALAIADRLQLRELRAYVLNDASRALISVESIPSALAALAEARQIWEETNNLPMLADNLSTTAEIAHVAGEIAMAEEFAARGVELSERIGNLWNQAYSGGTLLTLYIQRGETIRALAECDRVTRLSQESGFIVAAGISETQRAILYGELGQPHRGIESLSNVHLNQDLFFVGAWRTLTLGILHTMDENWAEVSSTIEQVRELVNPDDFTTPAAGFLGLLMAGLAVHQECYTDALDIVAPVLKRVREIGVRQLVPQLVLLQAQAYLGLGDLVAAKTTLQEAEAVARETFANFDLWEILFERSELERQSGDRTLADALKLQARELIQWLAAQAPPDLAASFLNLPKVRAALA